MTEDTRIAVVYARVSSVKQTKQGDGLASQETRCRDFAAYKGYHVEKVFHDEGVSGGIVNRPAMRDMLKWLYQHRKDEPVVIIDDVSRLARDLDTHRELRGAIGSVGASLESPSIEFGDDADSRMFENIVATFAQHQREKNAEQVVNRMAARLKNGYYVFAAPTGYKYERNAGRGKLLVRDEPTASVLQEALEGFASGRFAAQSEVKRFLEPHPVFARDANGEIRRQQIRVFLTNPVYAGHFLYKPWGVRLTKGIHEPLISFDDHQRILRRLDEKAYAPQRKDLHEDFPLRGFVACNTCEQPMTGYWAKGRNRRYAYYRCFNKTCPDRSKSIKRDVIEDAFTHLIAKLRPNEDLMGMAAEIFKDIWEVRVLARASRAKEQNHEIQRVDRKIATLMDRLIETQSTTSIKAYEKRLEGLETEKAQLQENLAKSEHKLPGFEQSFRTAMAFLANPCNLWHSDDPKDRNTLIKLVFAAPLPYDRETGFRTAKTTIPFKVLADMENHLGEVVSRDGFEPSTY